VQRGDVSADRIGRRPFDLDRLETRGDPVPVQEGVRTKGRIGATEVTLSANGTLLYVQGDEDFLNDRRLVWVEN